jgi:rubredoxin
MMKGLKMADASEREKYPCRICGLDFKSSVRDEYDLPQYDICPACGAEVGADDETLEEVQKFRQEWLETGARWWSPTRYAPPEWNPQEEMKNIPPEWL